MGIRVLSSGIDSLDVSVRGTVRSDLWDVLEDARQRAQDAGPVPVELGDTGQAFEVPPHGWRSYPLWLRSPDYQLMLGRSEAFPAALAQLGSAYLHSIGAGPGLRLVERTLRPAVLVGTGRLRSILGARAQAHLGLRSASVVRR